MENNALAQKYLTLLCYWLHGTLNVSAATQSQDEWYDGLVEFLTAYKVRKTPLKSLSLVHVALAEGRAAPAPAVVEHIEVVGQALFGILPAIQKDETLSRLDVRLYTALSLYMRKGSVNAWAVISRAAGPLDDVFAEEQVSIGSQDNLIAEMVELIEGLTGRRDVRLSSTEREHFSKEAPESYERFLALKRAIVDLSKAVIRDYVRKNKSSEGTVDYEELRKFLTTYGVLHNLPPGFVGRIDENVKFYTNDNLALASRPYFEVVMNPGYDPTQDNSYYCSCVTDKGNTQYFQTERVTKENREERFDLVQNFIPELPKIRAKWIQDLKRNDDSRECILAAMVELIYWASARVGSVGNKTDGKATYGISTLLKEHVNKVGQKLIVDYRGKSGVQQKHILTPKLPEEKLCASIVWRLAKEAEDDGRIFPYNNGTVNTYLRRLGTQATIHKLRHARATSMMMDRLKSCPFKVGKKADQKAAETWYREAAMDVGKELGHVSGERITELTALKSYISPELTISYFKDRKLRLPTWAEKFED